MNSLVNVHNSPQKRENGLRDRVMVLILDSPNMRIQDMAKALKVPAVKVYNPIQKMKQSGWIFSSGPGRYTLTDTGKREAVGRADKVVEMEYGTPQEKDETVWHPVSLPKPDPVTEPVQSVQEEPNLVELPGPNISHVPEESYWFQKWEVAMERIYNLAIIAISNGKEVPKE